MPYVLKNEKGYAKGRTRYTTTRTDDLQQARVFTRKSDAANAMQGGDIVEVKLVPVVVRTFDYGEGPKLKDVYPEAFSAD